jgi:hypothetical protein
MATVHLLSLGFFAMVFSVGDDLVGRHCTFMVRGGGGLDQSGPGRFSMHVGQHFGRPDIVFDFGCVVLDRVRVLGTFADVALVVCASVDERGYFCSCGSGLFVGLGIGPGCVDGCECGIVAGTDIM